MANVASPSYLANAQLRRRQLSSIRQQLLDQPGVPAQPAAPATAPAQDRTSPQEESLANRPQIPTRMEEEQAGTPVPPEGVTPAPSAEAGQPPVSLFDEQTRQEILAQAKPFLKELQREKIAQLHRRVGRARRFFGSGV